MTEEVEMREHISAYAKQRWRSSPWWTQSLEDDVDVATAESIFLPTRDEIMRHPEEVAILAALANANARTIELSWLSVTYDDHEGRDVVEIESADGLAVANVWEEAMVVLDPVTSTVRSVRTDSVTHIAIQDRPAYRLRPDEAQAYPLGALA